MTTTYPMWYSLLARHRAIRVLAHGTAPRAIFCAFHRGKAALLEHGVSMYVLSFDLDHREDVLAVPVVLTTLRRYGIAASFACIGRWIEEYPDVHRAIVTDGHEIVNHTYTHPDHPELAPSRSFATLTGAEQREEIAACHAACVRELGYAPVGFRTPHFGRAHTARTYGVLAELGYRYSSSTTDVLEPSYGIPERRGGGTVEIPLGCSSRFPFYTFDSWSARRAPHPLFADDGAFLEEFGRTMTAFVAQRSFLSHYFDPADVAGNVLDGFCAAIRRSGVVTMTYRSFLEQYRSHLWTSP